MSGKEKRSTDFSELTKRLSHRLEEIKTKRPKKKEEMADWVKAVEEGFKELTVAVGFCLAYIDADLTEQTEIFARSPLGSANEALTNLLGNGAHRETRALPPQREIAVGDGKS